MFDATSPTNYIIIRAPGYTRGMRFHRESRTTKYSTALSPVNWDRFVYWRYQYRTGIDDLCPWESKI